MKEELVDQHTGEIMGVDLDPPVKILTGKRKDGSTYFDLDFTGCPSKTEAHHARETDINYLVAKYKPDELALYLAARGASRQVQFHDFTLEPDLQNSMNIVYKLKKQFEALPENLQAHFGDALTFLKFVDNPQNEGVALKLGLIKQQAKTEAQKLQNQTQTNNQSEPQNNTQSTQTGPAPQGAT